MSGWRDRPYPRLAAGRFTEDEHVLIVLAAARSHESVAAWVRRTLLEQLDREAEQSTYRPASQRDPSLHAAAQRGKP